MSSRRGTLEIHVHVLTTVKMRDYEPAFSQVSLDGSYVDGNWHKYRLFRFLNSFLCSERKNRVSQFT